MNSTRKRADADFARTAGAEHAEGKYSRDNACGQARDSASDRNRILAESNEPAESEEPDESSPVSLIAAFVASVIIAVVLALVIATMPSRAAADTVGAAGLAATTAAATGATSSSRAPAALHLSSITAEGWVTNARHRELDSAISRKTQGMSASDGVRIAQLVGAADGYTFWKASLKGGNYGHVQEGSPVQGLTDSGVVVTRVRYYKGGLQFISENNGGYYDDGNWHFIDEGEWHPQLVFYYLQDERIGAYATIHMSDWYVPDFALKPYHTSKAVLGQVVDADTGESLALSDIMYYHNDHRGVSAITVTERNLANYEIVGIVKCAALETDTSRAWRYGGSCGRTLARYSLSDMTTGMNTRWYRAGSKKTGTYDPNRVVFQIRVRSPGQVRLTKRVTNDPESAFAHGVFSFDAQIEVPEDSELRDSYPVEGDANGAESLPVRSAGTGSGQHSDKRYSGRQHSGTMLGISVRAGETVTIKGLPVGSRVHFDEVASPTGDISDFSPTYAPVGGTVTAANPQRSNVQTVVATNAVSSLRGRLTVTQTLSGLGELTYAERSGLRQSLKISISGADIAPLRAANGRALDGDSVEEPGDDGSVTYVWELARLPLGRVQLTQTGHDSVSAPVTTSVQIDDGDVLQAASADVTIGKVTQKVKFASAYSSKAKPATVDALTVSKTVAGVSTDNNFSFILAPVAGTDTGSVEGLSDDGTLVASVNDDFVIKSPATSATHTATFPALSFTQEGTYEFSVREEVPDNGVPAGWEFDTDAVTVEISVTRSSADPKKLAAKVTYRYAKDDGDATAGNVRKTAFTNRFIPVSHLPLSGSWTEAAVLVAGIVVLTIGAAALIAVRRAHFTLRTPRTHRPLRTCRRTTR